jgi:beta-glucanase (GH16 family)
MNWRHKLAIGTSAIGAVVVWGAGFQAPLPAVGAPASIATVARGTLDVARAAPKPPEGKPIFDATFRGSRLNSKIWDTCYPWAANPSLGCTNFSNHQEAEWYQPSQVKVSGGVVRLTARRERTVGTTQTGARKVYACRSGVITSFPGFKFEYGFMQVVAKIPHANGLWPALWLSAANLKFPPEIDLVESWGVKAETASFFHPVTGRQVRARYSPKRTVGWHTYSLSWTKSAIRYYVDKKLVLTVKKNVPHQQMFFIANVAEYLPAKRGYCTGQLDIRSVKVWKG